MIDEVITLSVRHSPPSLPSSDNEAKSKIFCKEVSAGKLQRPIAPNALHAVITNVSLDGTAYQPVLLSLLSQAGRTPAPSKHCSKKTTGKSCFVSVVAFGSSSSFWIYCISLPFSLPSLNLREVMERRGGQRRGGQRRGG